jgi:glyoxylase-like metal-dependent hydrolase (beta-lactamase superfamily II)
MEHDIEITQVNWSFFLLDGGAMFGIIPRPLWSRLIAPDENNGIRLAMRSLVVRAEGRVILVDCGVWPYFPPKLRDQVYAIEQPDLEASLSAAAGIGPGDVTDIIASHLHFDHVGGFVRQEGEALVPRFANARFHVQRAQLDWALEPSAKDRGSYVGPLIEAIAGYDRLEIHDGSWALLPAIEVDVAHGHTPGMQITRVRHGDCWVIHTADMVPTSAHVPVPYIMAYDNEPIRTGEEKMRLFDRYPDAVYFFEHDPEWPFWTVTRNERGQWTRDEKALVHLTPAHD